MKLKDLIPFNWKKDTVVQKSTTPQNQHQTTDHPVYVDTFERFLEPQFNDWWGLPSFNWDFSSVTTKVNVTEAEDEIQIEAEMPGMDEKDIQVTVEEGRLILRGEKRQEHRSEKNKIHRIESTYGSFSREIRLPDYVKFDMAKAISTRMVY
jgi:HSP20 family protein